MRSRLTAVGEEIPAEFPDATPQAAQSPATQAALAGLLIALKALSQRAVVAVASLVDLALIASTFVLWWQIVDNPSSLQIVTVTIYSVFILNVVWLRRR